MNQVEEKIIARLLRIKKIGLLSIKYWNIVVTNQAVYFLQIGSNYAGFNRGLAIDIFLTFFNRSKDKKESIHYLKEQACYMIQINKEQLECICFERGLIRHKIKVKTNNKTYKFKLFPKKFNLLKNSIRQLKLIH